MLKFLTTIGVGVMAGVVSHPILRQMTGWPPSADSFSILIAIVTMGVVGSVFVLASSGKANSGTPVASSGDAVASAVVAGVAAVGVENMLSDTDVADAALDVGASVIGGLADLFSGD